MTTATRSSLSAPKKGDIHLWSGTLIPTTREAPADAETPSHIFMTRAGYIRRVGAGIYNYLPLAWRSLKKISQIVREEMDAAGASELLMPTLEPIELFKGTKRDVDYGDLLFKLEDRHGRTAALGPTHEEVITDLMCGALTSYKQFPLNLYQIQTKFRDEFRPRAGLLRCREFIMKDAYSFHLDLDGEAGLNATYDKMYRAYTNIFTRCGLDFSAVEAEAGPIGGSASHEFMVNCANGEDTILVCPKSGYAANVEKAEIGERAKGTFSEPPSGDLVEVHTPNLPGIEEVGHFMKVKPERMLKTVVFLACDGLTPSEATEEISRYYYKAKLVCQDLGITYSDLHHLEYEEIERRVLASGHGSQWHNDKEDLRDLRKRAREMPFVLAVVTGVHEVNEGKLKMLAGEPVVSIDRELLDVLGVPVGYVSPRQINRYRKAKLLIDADASLGGFWASGADRSDYHVKHFNWRREVGSVLDDTTRVKVGDLRNAVAGDPSPRATGSVLETRRGIEVGHIFKLGTKYSDAMGLSVLDKDQQKRSVIMGCYGIGVSRTLAACVEMAHDDNGICMPPAIAPYHIHIVTIKPNEDGTLEKAEAIARELSDRGLDVLIDDRDERPGPKFKDADLIGIPVRLTVSPKALGEGGVEFKLRKDEGKGEVVPLGEVVDRADAAVLAMMGV